MQKKRIFLFIMCIALTALVCLKASDIATAQNQTGNVSFKTPEEAITLYMQGVTQGDVGKILQACAINEVSENFKFDLYTDRLKAFIPYQSPAPSNYPFYVEMNKAQLTSQILGQVKIFVFSLLSSEKIADGNVIIIDPDRTAKFIKDVDPTKLAQLEVKKFALPNKTIMSSTKYTDNVTKIARVYGADEYTERVALFLFDGNYYFMGFTLLRYGETWKILNANSPLAGTSSIGAPQKTTEKDFEGVTN
ncbi:MAG: hypothetical protein ABI947_24895 [Chloroflexota bacterium]